MPALLPRTVVYDDDVLVAVDKPSGVPTLPVAGEHASLIAIVREQFPEASILHRLERHTSGLVLFARTRAAAAQLARAWRDQTVRKTYRAWSVGETRTQMFVIDTPIGPVPHPLLGSEHAAARDGQPAHSVATVLDCANDRTLFSVELMAGRPHQVRIHLAYAGYPLAGDPLYEMGGGLKRHPGLLDEGGYLLHQERLQFCHPVSGAPMSLVAAPPAALQTATERLTVRELTPAPQYR